MSDHIPTSEVLNRAADLVESRGWATGNEAMRADGGPLCLEGAIGAALGVETFDDVYVDAAIYSYGQIQDCPAYAAVKDYLGRRLATIHRFSGRAETQELWSWNDERGRTATEVVEVLRAAALIESAREREAAEVSA